MHWPSVAWGLDRIDARELQEWQFYFELLAEKADPDRAPFRDEDEPHAPVVDTDDEEDDMPVMDGEERDINDLTDEEFEALLQAEIKAEQERLAKLSEESGP